MNPTTGTQSKFDPVKLLSQAFSYLKHVRLMIVVFALAIMAGITYYIFATPVYQSTSLVYFQAFGSAVRNSELQETMVSPSRLSRSLIDRLNSQRVKIAAGQKLGFLSESATIEDFKEHIPSVRIGIVDGRHLEVTVMAYDSDVVRNFTQALVEEFQEFQEESWTQFRDEALERYALQLKELEQKVAENVDSLSDLERDQQYTEVTIEQQNLLQIPKDLVETRERVKRMDLLRKSLDEQAESNDTEGMLTTLSLLSNFEEETEVEVGNLVQRPISGVRNVTNVQQGPVHVVKPAEVEGLEPWRELERKKRLLEAEIKEASEIYLPDHPKMRELTAELDSTERALVTELGVLREKFDLEHQHLKEKIVQLEARIPEYQAVTKELGKSALKYNSVEQSQRMWDTAREKMAEKLATLNFAEDFDWVQLRFKGHTSLRDEDPISPNKRKLVIFSFLLGIAGALGLPTALNLLDTSATTVSQLEEYIGLKGIGIVPLADPEFLEAVHRSPAQGSTVPNYLLECFRVIRANIGLDDRFTQEAKSQVILVTSARPQEGKTTQAANLAWAYHSMGERVLLIDCDLRRGRVHGLLDMDNQVGMSRMLIGECSPEAAIIHTEQDGFDAIPRGPIIPGATELLCQSGFQETINNWKQKYDRIILDCPPILGLSESTSLQRLADGIVLVIRSEVTSMKDVKDGVGVLTKTGAHFYGFVLNGVDLSKVGNYYQYYYYSAPYYDQFTAEAEKQQVARQVATPPKRDEAVPPPLANEQPQNPPFYTPDNSSAKNEAQLPAPRPHKRVQQPVPAERSSATTDFGSLLRDHDDETL